MNAPNNTLSIENETVLELLVNNHPGVMSHVCNLFSRRAYNLEGIAVLPVETGEKSKIWLKMNEQQRLEQIIKQLKKMHDIMDVKQHPSSGSIFSKIAPYFSEKV